VSDTLGFYAIAEETPDRRAIADPDYNEISYGQLYELVNRISNGLQAASQARTGRGSPLASPASAAS